MVRSWGSPAEQVDIQGLLGDESIATTQIDTHFGQERVERVVVRW